MSTAAIGPAPIERAGFLRWSGCLLLMLALHAAAVLLLLSQPAPDGPALASEAILIDLTPVPAEPAAAPEPSPAEPAAAATPSPAAPEAPPEPLPPPPPAPPPEAAPPPEPPVAPPLLPEPLPPPPPPEAPLVSPPKPTPPPAPRPRRAAPPRPTHAPAAERPRVAEPARPAAAAAAPNPAPAAPPASSSNAVPTWQGQIVGRLQRFKRYPEAARHRREEGVALLTFTMDRAGHVLSARIARGSGSAELDAEVLALVRRAEPLPEPPPEMPGNPLTLTVPVRFSLR